MGALADPGSLVVVETASRPQKVSKEHMRDLKNKKIYYFTENGSVNEAPIYNDRKDGKGRGIG